VTGPREGKFHSLVTEYGLDPVVLIISRDLEFGDPLRALLKQLDDTIEKNRAAGLHGFVVFVSEDLPDVVTADDRRDELAGRVRDLAGALMLKQVVLCLGGKAALEGYGAGDAALTVVLYRNYKVLASYALAGDRVTDAQVKEIMTRVGAELVPTRK